jgi:ubiquinone/menaquinone biosynthesis C-methylase UbiE
VTFQDHFSSVAGPYARFRPSYDAALFTELAARAPARERAWDCGTGSGQAAIGLAAHFRSVVATDPSTAQLAAWADRAPGVARVACTAEAAALADGSVDLITVAQALHWFDTAAFYGEVRRVARPGGLLAVWSYALCRIDAAVDQAVDALYHDVLGAYWAPARRHVETGYRTLPFPFTEEPAPTGRDLTRALTRTELEGYVGTWSAVRAARRAGVEPLTGFRAALARAWPDAGDRRMARWSLAVRIGRVGTLG